jgi:hypothetical protein
LIPALPTLHSQRIRKRANESFSTKISTFPIEVHLQNSSHDGALIALSKDAIFTIFHRGLRVGDPEQT